MNFTLDSRFRGSDILCGSEAVKVPTETAEQLHNKIPPAADCVITEPKRKFLDSHFHRNKVAEVPTETSEQLHHKIPPAADCVITEPKRKFLDSHFHRSEAVEALTETSEQLHNKIPPAADCVIAEPKRKFLDSHFGGNSIHKKRGFSLLEILIAIAIFASSMLFIFPSIKKTENEIKKTLRTLQALNRTLYSHSRIQNKVYRLALKTHLQKSSYWVEVKTPLSEMQPPSDEQSSDTSENLRESPFFQKDTQTFKTQELPSGVYFEWTENSTENATESDILYVTYDPHLLTHTKQIFLKKGIEFTWTLSFNPLLGELEILEGENESS